MSSAAIPARREQKLADTWDLSRLFASDDAWHEGLKTYEALIPRITTFQGTLAASADALADWLDFYRDLGILEERLSYYCELRQTEDEGADDARTMTGRFVMAQARAETAASWATPELQAVDAATMTGFLTRSRLQDYAVYLRKILRWKPHILSAKEERLLALHGETEGTLRDVFTVLTNVDMDFGAIDTPEGPRPLSQSTWSSFLEKDDRDLRRRAYTAFYHQFDAHKTSLATLYGGSVKQDAVQARLRGFGSARAAALFPDDVPESVYDNLVSTVNAHLEPLHRYYALRKRALGLEELRHYDVYVPIVPSDIRAKAQKRTSWNEAVALIGDALAPLGGEYVDTLRSGFGPLGGPLREQGQTVRRFFRRQLYRRPLHPDELQGRPDPGHLYPGPRGRPFHAQLVFRPVQSLPELRLHHLRGRGGQHLQRGAALPPSG